MTESPRSTELKGMGMRLDELPREVLRYVDNLKQQIKDILGKHNLTIADITNTLPLEETSSASTALSDFFKDPKWNSLKKSPPDYKKLAELMNLLLKTVQTGEIPPEADPRETWNWKEGEHYLSNWEKDWKQRFLYCWEPAFSPDGEKVAAGVRDSQGWTIAIDGEPLEERFEAIFSLAWSPEGEKIMATLQKTNADLVRIVMEV